MLDSILRILKSNSRLGLIGSWALFGVLFIGFVIADAISHGGANWLGLVIELSVTAIITFVIPALLLFGKDKIAKIITIVLFVLWTVESMYGIVGLIIYLIGGSFLPLVMSIRFLIELVFLILVIVLFILTHITKTFNFRHIIPFVFIALIVFSFLFEIIVYLSKTNEFSWFNISSSLLFVFLPIIFLFSYMEYHYDIK